MAWSPVWPSPRRSLAVAGVAAVVAALAATLVLTGATRTLDLAVLDTVQRPLGEWDGEPPAANETDGGTRGAWRPHHTWILGKASDLGHYRVSQGAFTALALAALAFGSWRAAAGVGLWGVLNAMATSSLQSLAHPASEALRAGVTSPVPVFFPSGHTMGAVATWGAVAWVLAAAAGPRCPRWVPLAATIGVGAAVATDRILTAQHVVGDVVGGLALGTVSLGLALAALAWLAPARGPPAAAGAATSAADQAPGTATTRSGRTSATPGTASTAGTTAAVVAPGPGKGPPRPDVAGAARDDARR